MNDAQKVQTVLIHATVLDPRGQTVAETTSATQPIDSQQTDAIALALPVNKPALWSTTTRRCTLS
jgi:hypothetical protein